jgi:hypothetical protein
MTTLNTFWNWAKGYFNIPHCPVCGGVINEGICQSPKLDVLCFNCGEMFKIHYEEDRVHKDCIYDKEIV